MKHFWKKLDLVTAGNKGDSLKLNHIMIRNVLHSFFPQACITVMVLFSFHLYENVVGFFSHS